MKRTFSVLFVASLVVAACGGDGGDTTTSAASDESTTTSPEGTSTIAGGTSTSAETSTTAGGSAGGDDCLVGSWVLDDEAFFEQVFADTEDTTGFGDATAVSGTFTTVLNADGSVEAVRADWGFTVDTEEGTFNIVINGSQRGTWETDGSTLLLAFDEGTGFDVEATVVVDGEEIVLPSAPMEVPGEALSSSSEFTCSGDTLTVTSEGITSEFERS